MANAQGVFRAGADGRGEDGTMDVDFRITVGILGAQGEVLPDMHGHRSDGDSPVQDRGVEECRFLVEPAVE